MSRLIGPEERTGLLFRRGDRPLAEERKRKYRANAGILAPFLMFFGGGNILWIGRKRKCHRNATTLPREEYLQRRGRGGKRGD